MRPRAWACRRGSISLDGQFRCGGSRAYEHWVLRLLGLEGEEPVAWEGDDHFELSVADAPSDGGSTCAPCSMRGTAPVWLPGTAGSGATPCRTASSQTCRSATGIGPGTTSGDSSHAGAPGTPFWASDPAGFEQVGCVYTAQGFEYDYSGVIMGPDLVWRDDRWVRPEFSFDAGPVKRGDRRGVRPRGAQHLQGAADSRDAGNDGLLDRCRDPGAPPLAGSAACTRLRQ